VWCIILELLERAKAIDATTQSVKINVNAIER
jgi:hypothetical protein